jgi:acyl-coenzyme A synthetase/AMP-(fatty) acid ligase
MCSLEMSRPFWTKWAMSPAPTALVNSCFVAVSSLSTSGRTVGVEGHIRADDTDLEARVLHTVDLAHIDADSLCTIVGRKDRQMKINGMRVEPGEAEAALRDLDEVRDAAVIDRRFGKTSPAI